MTMGVDDSPDATGSNPSLDPAGQALFERIGAKLGLPIAVQERRIGRFVIRGQLGLGGMGVVYRAYDPKLDREVALKLIHARAFAKLDVLRARLLQEAKVLAQLQHDNVVRVYEADEHEGEVFVALELVDGPDLRAWQRAESPTSEQILRVFIKAGTGLAAAHEREIVHRDFKPDNVLISGARVLVGDFGLAGSIAAFSAPGEVSDSTIHERLTDIGEVIGTTGYMPPEQLRGDDINDRSDQYAYCVSLWELLTGERPFTDKTRAGLLVAMNGGAPTGGEGLPRWLRAVLIRGLSADPKQRWPNMLALVGRLEQGLLRKRRWLLGGSFGLAAIVTITSLTVAMRHEAEPPCPLEESLAELVGSDNWQALADELDNAGHGATLTRLETKLERRAASLCPTDRDAAKQKLELWLDALRLIAASAGRRTPEQLRADIETVNKADFQRPPRERIPSNIAKLLSESEQFEREARLPEALERANEALEAAEAAESRAGRALALLRRGRVHALSDDNDLALPDYVQARRAADEAQYPDASLRAYLLTARTEIMRLDRLARGEQSLLDARSLLIGLHERIDSPRWIEYHQLAATLYRHREDFEPALFKQRRVLIQTWISADRYEVGLALLNLGVLRVSAKQPARAEVCFRLALHVLHEPSPARHQAAYNLGRLLVFEHGGELQPEQIAESRQLLNAVIAADPGQRIPAMYSLLALAFQLEETDEAGRMADDLSDLLTRDPTTTPRRRLEAWQFIAMSKAERKLDHEPASSQFYAAADEMPASEEDIALFEIEMITLLGLADSRDFASRLEARLPTIPDSLRIEIRDQLDSLQSSDDSTSE